MSKRTIFPGAFALPGLAHDKRGNSATRLTDLRSDAERNSVDIETQRTLKTCTADSTTLVDKNGEFLPQQTEVNTLKHLTKSRPRSPARRPGHPTKRERSRSPDNNHDVFEHYAGLKHNTQSTTTESKQHDETQRASRSRINKNTSKPIIQYENEAQQKLVRDSNTVIITSNHYPTSVTKLNHSSNSTDANLNLDMSRHDYNSDEDLVDMLIADYEDSDDSDSDDKPPLPTSPPPDVEEKTSSIDTSLSTQTNNKLRSHEITTSSKLFPNLRNVEENSNDGITKVYDNQNKLFPSISTTEDDHVSSGSDIRDKHNNIYSLSTTASTTTQPSNANSMTTLANVTSKSSARRRRFKPVSIDTVETSDDTDKLSYSDSMNRTFPKSMFDSSDSNGKSRKEVDWGLRTGPLNSSFTESTLKSGTMFDKFLKDNNKNSNDTQITKESTQNPHDEDMQSNSMNTRSISHVNHYDKDKLKDVNMEDQMKVTQKRNNEIPTIQIHSAEDNTEKQSLSTLFSLESGSEDLDDDYFEDDDNDESDNIVDNVSNNSDDDYNERTLNHGEPVVDHDDVDSNDNNENTLRFGENDAHDNDQYNDDDNNGTVFHKRYALNDIDDDNDRALSISEYDIHQDGDDEDDDDYSFETSGYSPSFISNSKHPATSNLKTTLNTLTVDDNDDITHITDIDDDLIASSDEEIAFNQSLGSVVDTHDNTMYSPGEIPGMRYSDQKHTVTTESIKEDLYSPPQWENSEDDDSDNMDDYYDHHDISGKENDKEKQHGEMKYLDNEDGSEGTQSNNGKI